MPVAARLRVRPQASVRQRAGQPRRGQLTSPKSGKVRAVPLAPDAAQALAELARREDASRPDFGPILTASPRGESVGLTHRRKRGNAMKRLVLFVVVAAMTFPMSAAGAPAGSGRLLGQLWKEIL